MPMAIGTAITSAKIELSTVTRNRSAMPNRRLSASVVLNSELVKKLALFACNDGMARIKQEQTHQGDRPDDRRAGRNGDRPEDAVTPATAACLQRLTASWSGRHLGSIADLLWARRR